MTNSKYFKLTYRGFTLLELLLVIAILGVMATFGLSLFQQQTDRLKVEKASLQMQQILAAASAYYSQNNSWPTSCTDPTFADFLPVGSTLNPWGNNYTCQPSQQGKKFTVISGEVISSSTAAQIEAILPSAVNFPLGTAKATQVMSEIAIPADIAGQTLGFLLKYVGVTGLTLDQGVIAGPDFSCPSGFDGKAIASPVAIHTDPWQYSYLNWCSGYGRGSRAISLINTISPACSVTAEQNGENLYKCNFQVQYQTNFLALSSSIFLTCGFSTQNLGNIQFAIMEYCVPKNSQANAVPVMTPF